MKYQKPKILNLGESIENAKGFCNVGNHAGTGTGQTCDPFGSSAGEGQGKVVGCGIGSSADGYCGTGTAAAQGPVP